jgi:hypothetical protein
MTITLARAVLLAALTLGALLGATRALADAQGRCDTSVIERGQTFYEVEERCGAPVYEYSRTDFRYPGYFVQVDEWVYDFGPNRFRRQLTFEDGRLRKIEKRAKPRRAATSRTLTEQRTVHRGAGPWLPSPQAQRTYR